MIKKTLKTINIKDLKEYWKNNKIHKDNVLEIVKSIQANTYIAPIIVDENYEILAWHWRKLALENLWSKEIEVLIIEWLSDKQKKDYRLRDNKLSELSQWNFENIEFELEELDIPELNELFMDKLEVEYEDLKDNDSKYNRSVEAPIYKPSWNIRNIKDIYNSDKTNELIKQIDKANIKDKDIIDFLKASAYRHTQFNFGKIADFYSTCDNEKIKELMEESVLVIIDYEQAIEKWYVEISNMILNTNSENE